MRATRLQRLLLTAHTAVLLVASGAVATTSGDSAATPASSAARDTPVHDASAVLAVPRPATTDVQAQEAPATVMGPALPVAASAVDPTAVRMTERAGRSTRSDRRGSGGAQRSGPVLTPEQRGRQALNALRYPWQDLGYSVRFERYTGGRLGLADRRKRAITVYVKPRQDEVELRATIAHELGHALDFEHGDESRRQRYLELRGVRTSASWFPCGGCDDLDSPAGDWAEVFAAALVGTSDFRSRLAGPPTAEQLSRLAPLFEVPRPSAPPPPPPPEEQQEDEEEPRDDGLLPLRRVPAAA